MGGGVRFTFYIRNRYLRIDINLYILQHPLVRIMCSRNDITTLAYYDWHGNVTAEK